MLRRKEGGGSPEDIVFADLVEKRAAVDAQHLGGVGAVLVAVVEGTEDEFFLHVSDGGADWHADSGAFVTGRAASAANRRATGRGLPCAPARFGDA